MFNSYTLKWVLIILLLIIIVYIYTSFTEKFATSSTEAILDISSMYNNDTLTAHNLNITGTITVGSTTIDSSGNITTPNVKIDSCGNIIINSSGNITIKSETSQLRLGKNKFGTSISQNTYGLFNETLSNGAATGLAPVQVGHYEFGNMTLGGDITGHSSTNFDNNTSNYIKSDSKNTSFITNIDNGIAVILMKSGVGEVSCLSNSGYDGAVSPSSNLSGVNPSYIRPAIRTIP